MAKADVVEVLEVLKKLQTVDRQLYNLARMREYEPRRQREAEGTLASEESRLKDLNDRHTKYQKDISRKELDVKGRQEKINKLKSQLLSAATNREYQSFTKEIALEEAEKGKLEEELLEMMIGIEGFTAEEVKIKADMIEEKKKVDAIRAEVKSALEDIKKKEATLLAERSEVASKLESETLRRYEGLFKSRGGEAVVLAAYEPGTGGEEGQYQCKGCFMPLTHQMVNLLILGQEIVTCKSCGRILFIEDAKPKG
jgi:uncharacterized protein